MQHIFISQPWKMAWKWSECKFRARVGLLTKLRFEDQRCPYKFVSKAFHNEDICKLENSKMSQYLKSLIKMSVKFELETYINFIFMPSFTAVIWKNASKICYNKMMFIVKIWKRSFTKFEDQKCSDKFVGKAFHSGDICKLENLKMSHHFKFFKKILSNLSLKLTITSLSCYFSQEWYEIMLQKLVTKKMVFSLKIWKRPST